MINSQELIDNKYQIIKEIGSGGTGVVLLAYHVNLQKYVVLKRIKQWTMSHDMFRREADLLKNLHHMYLPQVYDFISVGNEIYTVIDYIQGCSLEDYINSGTVVDMDTVRMWFTQLAEVLCYLHNREPQIIHSDIKPANILITPDNNICLIDFNISLDGSADVSGYSRFYASPEQILSSNELMSGIQPSTPVDCRTDIYSLGASFYHLISGQCPSDETVNTPLTELVGSDDVFLDIVDRCMSFDPNDRPQSANDVLKQLRNIYKMTVTYKVLNIVRWLSVLLGTVCICAGVILCVKGAEVSNNDEFKAEYDKVFTLYRSGNYDEVLSNGKNIINSNSYRKYLDDDKQLKAELFHLLALSYYEMQDYRNSAIYSKNAFDETNQQNEQYYLEYITALIKSGDVSSARNAFNEAGKYGIDSARSDAIKSEFLLSESNYDGIINLFESKKNDPSYQNNSLLLENYALALSYKQNYSKAIEYCQKAYECDKSDHNMRRMGEAYVDLANVSNKNGDAAGAKKATAQAMECFERLTKNKYGLSSDYINLLHCYLQMDKKAEGESLVEKMTSKFTSDYRIYAEIADYYSKISQSTLAAEYANKARALMKDKNMTDSDRYYLDILNGLPK